MKLPASYDDDILGYEGGYYPDGSPITPRVYSLVYPPIGFFPFYGIGNGDYHGFYWPIGREDGPPIVAFSSHDAGSLIPEHSDIEALYRCQLARSIEGDENIDCYRELVKEATGKLPATHDIRGISHDDFRELLSLDPTSSFYLCAAADVDVAKNEIDAAEQRYRQSLDQLPEYVAAHFVLAAILRRRRRIEDSTIHLRMALIGPLAFYGGSFWSDTSLPGSFRNDWHRKALMWLQQSNLFHESLTDDPFIKHIGALTFQTGLAENPDIGVLQVIVDEYASAGAYAEAARIWQLIGDRASCETTSFRERYDLKPTTYGTRLAELLELSGNTLRAELVRNMLAAMEKPQGPYL
jgi:hypothetical protein